MSDTLKALEKAFVCVIREILDQYGVPVDDADPYASVNLVLATNSCSPATTNQLLDLVAGLTDLSKLAWFHREPHVSTPVSSFNYFANELDAILIERNIGVIGRVLARLVRVYVQPYICADCGLYSRDTIMHQPDAIMRQSAAMICGDCIAPNPQRCTICKIPRIGQEWHCDVSWQGGLCSNCHGTQFAKARKASLSGCPPKCACGNAVASRAESEDAHAIGMCKNCLVYIKYAS